MQIDHQLVALVVSACRQAGACIMDVYRAQGPMHVEHKSDASPVTQADLQADAILRAELTRILPDVPVLSEESVMPSYEERKHWSLYWLVDPLDGTREFVSKNGEFTVNVALIRGGQPVLGVVFAPAWDQLFWGAEGLGAAVQTQNAEQNMSVAASTQKSSKPGVIRVVQSRRADPIFEEKLEQKVSDVMGAQLQMTRMGSSLKYCLVAKNDYDLSVMPGLTSEWDTAAAQAVLRYAGGTMHFSGCKTYSYNKPDILNPPYFAAAGDLGDLGLWLGQVLQSNWNNKV